MSRIMKRVGISATVDQVWQVLADFGSAEKWAPTVVQSRCPTEVKRGMGARRTLTTTTGQVTEELVTEWDEGHCFTFEIPSGLASVIKILRETWTVEPSPQGTVVVVIMECQMKDGGINSLLGSLVVERVLKKMLVQNLAGLKHHIETGELVTSKTAKLPVAAVS